jgi:threonine dehydrogenase-like Zn-dependent dehydrogenase
MRAVAVYPESHEVRLVEHEEPHIVGPEEVKLRVLEVGVCGTDRHICQSSFGVPPTNDDYLILGHEALGKVVAVGTGVQTLKPGDLVVPEVRRPCTDSACRPCRAGRQDFCTTAAYAERGIVRLHGYMTEFVVDEARYLNKIPPYLSDVAVLVEPLTIAEKALLSVWQVQQRLPWLYPEATPEQPGRGLRAVVLGAGPIGLLGAMALISAGFTTYIYARSPLPNSKATVATAIGATYVSSVETPIDELARQVGAIDLVYEAMDAAPAAIEIMPHLGPNGIFVFTSQTNPHSPLGIDAALAFQHIIGWNQVILGTVNAGHDAFVSAIHDLDIFHQHWPQALRSLITERHAMEEVATLLLDKPGGIKHVVRIG